MVRRFTSAKRHRGLDKQMKKSLKRITKEVMKKYNMTTRTLGATTGVSHVAIHRYAAGDITKLNTKQYIKLIRHYPEFADAPRAALMPEDQEIVNEILKDVL